MTVSTTVLAIPGIFRGGGGGSMAASGSLIDEGTLKNS